MAASPESEFEITEGAALYTKLLLTFAPQSRHFFALGFDDFFREQSIRVSLSMLERSAFKDDPEVVEQITWLRGHLKDVVGWEEQALPLLKALVVRIEDMLNPPLYKPDEYREEWVSIIRDWNEEVLAHGWKLSTLCEVCGRPVKWFKKGLRPRGGRVGASTVCEDTCRKLRKARRYAKKARQRHRKRRESKGKSPTANQ